MWLLKVLNNIKQNKSYCSEWAFNQPKTPRLISLLSVWKIVSNGRKMSSSIIMQTCWAMDTCKWEEVVYFSNGRHGSVGGIISIMGLRQLVFNQPSVVVFSHFIRIVWGLKNSASYKTVNKLFKWWLFNWLFTMQLTWVEIHCLRLLPIMIWGTVPHLRFI